ncbi:hypothetical protein ENH_00068580 [Eimeria necatrix]|uniref:Formate/nitrite transporter n=1 Tax=Eimeria necatrix TaxID=51315 RepID=U6MPG8_9EIME|nr:hypothetical protein ENH_00068580 [Eimeria necatrix]CDJ64384.1 hypothetical protein ENH_00068580 [Eimeria necatrix]
MMGCEALVGSVVVQNFVPTFLGNMVGGCFSIGAVYWYNFYPVEEYTHRELLGGPQGCPIAPVPALSPAPISSVPLNFLRDANLKEKFQEC